MAASGGKSKGFLVVSAALTAIVFILLSGVVVGFYSGVFSMLGSSRTASIAQQYAEFDANTLTLLAYDDLPATAHGRSNIEGADGWQSEIIIGAEKTVGDESRRRIGTVKIYKSGEGTPRSSLQVPLSSKGGRSNKFFAGWEVLAVNSGIADTDGIIVATSYSNTDMSGYTSGNQRFYVSRRDKYGQGSTTGSMPIMKGEAWSVHGAQSIQFMRIK